LRYVIFQRDFYMRTSWLKALILISALPVLASAHTASPYILPDVFDTSSANSVSFQSSITLEKFFVPSFNLADSSGKCNSIKTSHNFTRCIPT